MFKATLKSLFARKVRLILTVVSIVLGVGFVSGTFVLTDTMNKAFDDLFQTAASGSDVIVRSEQAFVPTAAGPGGGGGEERDPVPEDLVATVRAVDGVASASGDLQGYAQMKDPETGDPIGGVGPPTIGTNWTDTNPSLVLREGEPPRTRRGRRRCRHGEALQPGGRPGPHDLVRRDRAGGLHDQRHGRLR